MVHRQMKAMIKFEAVEFRHEARSNKFLSYFLNIDDGGKSCVVLGS